MKITTEEIRVLLTPYTNQIVCNQCGECCGTCPTRRGNLCGAHPEYKKADAAPDMRAGTCWAEPVELLYYYPHIACPLVVSLLEKLGYRVDIYHNDRDIPCIKSIALSK